jgi:hypothetical protein
MKPCDESDYCEFQLHSPATVFADMIFDSCVSPAPSGLRGFMSGHHMRFISRGFDIHLRLTTSGKEKSLFGHLGAGSAAPEPALIRLLVDGELYAATATNAFGDFEIRGVRFGSAALEILVPSHRIVTAFDVTPD